MKKYLFIAIVTIGCLIFSGCGTTVTHLDWSKSGIGGGKPNMGPYAGTRYDLMFTHMVYTSEHKSFNGCFWITVLCLCDLPFCLVGDTLLLPYDSYIYLDKELYKTKAKKEVPYVKAYPPGVEVIKEESKDKGSNNTNSRD